MGGLLPAFPAGGAVSKEELPPMSVRQTTYRPHGHFPATLAWSRGLICRGARAFPRAGTYIPPLLHSATRRPSFHYYCYTLAPYLPPPFSSLAWVAFPAQAALLRSPIIWSEESSLYVFRMARGFGAYLALCCEGTQQRRTWHTNHPILWRVETLSLTNSVEQG